MSLHKARPDEPNPDPLRPKSTVMTGGRIARPHDEVLGGIQHAQVGDAGRSKEDEKEKVHDYHARREEVKKVAKDTFDEKTGEPKEVAVKFGAAPAADAKSSPAPVEAHTETKKDDKK